MATLMNASLLAVVRSYSLDSRRDRPSHPNVRSTIHRFGWTTNPTCPANFLTTTPTHPQWIQPWVRAVSKWVSPHTTFSRLTAARSRSISPGPPATTLAEAVRGAGARWAGEDLFELAKGDCGSDEYEVRSWAGWHRHVTLSLFALAVVAVIRSRVAKPAKKGARS